MVARLTGSFVTGSRLARDRRGIVAVLFALMLIPLIGMVGLAIDFAVVSQAKQRLDLALDAATMQAVTAAAQATNSDPNASLLPAQAAGVQRFAAQLGQLAAVTMQPVNITITRDGTLYTAVGSYSGNYHTYLGAIFGVGNMAIAGSATAVYQTQPYTDVQLVLDVSSSMLIAGSATDIANLTALTGSTQVQSNLADGAQSIGWGACAFACHWKDAQAAPGTVDYYEVAQQNGITLRFNQLQSAIGTIATSLAAANTQSRYRLGLWTFSDTLTQQAALTTDTASVVSIVQNIQPGLWSVTGRAEVDGHNTMVNEAIQTLASDYVAVGGDGTSRTQPRKFIFLMTDGVEDSVNPANPNGRVESALNPAYCDRLKAPAAQGGENATVVVMYTAFYDPSAFQEIAALFNPPDTGPVPAALKACASTSELYYEVSTQSDINQAVQQFLTNVLGVPARLSH